MSIDKGQWEAAYCIGLSKKNVYADVILPQAFRNTLPSLASQAISTVKDSALVSTIAIYDLTMRGREIISETFLSFEIWFTVAAIYLVLTLGLQACIHMIDRLLHSNM
jgi:polar amino acid transport system permease protein